MIVAPRFGRYGERFVASPSDEVLLLKVLRLTLLVAGIAQQLQASTTVGAFLLGIALSGPLAIAGLAIAARVAPQLGPLVAAYVPILAVAGPLIARTAEPLVRWSLRRRATQRAAV